MNQPLSRLRLRLTAWYAATFGLILLLLGGGLFLSIRAQISRQLDVSLLQATRALQDAARIREIEQRTARGNVVDAVDELHIPDRSLYLLNPDGTPVKPAAAPPWIAAAARAAARSGSVDLKRHTRDATLRIQTERFVVPGGRK